MREVQSALNTAAADDSKLVLLSAVGSVFCCGLDFIYFIRRLTDDRKRESTKMAEAIRYAEVVCCECWFGCSVFGAQSWRAGPTSLGVQHTASYLWEALAAEESPVSSVGLAKMATCLGLVASFKAGSFPECPGRFL